MHDLIPFLSAISQLRSFSGVSLEIFLEIAFPSFLNLGWIVGQVLSVIGVLPDLEHFLS